jgi:hypothetical protein
MAGHQLNNLQNKQVLRLHYYVRRIIYLLKKKYAPHHDAADDVALLLHLDTLLAGLCSSLEPS